MRNKDRELLLSSSRLPTNRLVEEFGNLVRTQELTAPYLVEHPIIPNFRWDPRTQRDVDAMMGKEKKKKSHANSPLYTRNPKEARARAVKDFDGAYRVFPRRQKAAQ